ncbi:MAG: 2-dehydro-3-deoxygalactonokinase, partial [Lachnospiraceae bacterium]|nr:2-dehydro-3-deoxygalactonokinase [Lachnospiraceae bacterium]
IYLLDRDFEVLYVDKKNVGSRNSSIEGSNRVLIEGLYELYTKLMNEKNLKEEDIENIYMSGMITSPYGMKEVPHLVLPLTVQGFADSLYCHYEDACFKRNIYLVPGIKTVNEDFSFVGNMRGEEIEIIGTLDELREKGITHAALMMPGSHTHVTYVKDDVITDIISNFTGELFYALKKETIMAPILSAEVSADELDGEMIHKALENLKKFGFNRSLYICHAMRIMESGTPQQRFSYGEGVVNGGLRQAVEYYCENRWQGCETLVIVSDEFMYKLFSIIFEGSPYIKNIVWMPISATKSYAVKGLKKIVSLKGESNE